MRRVWLQSVWAGHGGGRPGLPVGQTLGDVPEVGEGERRPPSGDGALRPPAHHPHTALPTPLRLVCHPSCCPLIVPSSSWSSVLVFLPPLEPSPCLVLQTRQVISALRVSSLSPPTNRVATGQKSGQFKVREKSGNFVLGQGNLRFWEKSGKYRKIPWKSGKFDFLMSYA